MNETRTLARFVAETTFTDLPRRLVENLKITVLDTVGAALVGTRQPWAQRIVAVVKALGGAPEASVIHQGWRTDVSRAACANGVLIGAFECEPLTGSHASGTVLPAALAVCECRRLDGVAFLTALALGFEVSARIARTAVGLETVRGFHNPGTQGPFGADAAHVTQQAVVQAIQELKREHPLDPRAITRVVVRGAERIMEERHAAREPGDVLGGQYSLPFTTAVALTRDMSNPLVYDLSAVNDPIVRDLARRIELVAEHAAAHDSPGFWPAEIVIECGGQRHTLPTRPHKGSPANPFTWEEAGEKFRRYTASILDARQVEGIVGAVAGLEHATDMSGLARILVGV